MRYTHTKKKVKNYVYDDYYYDKILMIMIIILKLHINNITKNNGIKHTQNKRILLLKYHTRRLRFVTSTNGDSDDY